MKLEVHRFEAADGMTNDTHTINRSLHRQSTAFERLDDIRSVYDLTHINATKSTDGAAAEEAATSIKLAEALEIARQNFYKGKVSMVCLADEASGGDGGYVDKPVGGDTTTTTTITTATSASPPAPAPAAAKTRDVDALVQQLDEHIEQCVTYTTGTALLNESGAVTSCCSEQQLHAAVEQATRLLANVPRVLNAIDELLLLPPPPSVAVDDEKRQQQQQQAATVDAVLGNVAYGTRQFDAYLSVLAESVAKHMASARDATNEAAKPEQQQQLIATVDKQVSEMRDAVRRMSDALAKIQPLAQVDKVEVATESSAPVAGVEVQVEAEEHDIKKAITIG